MRSGIWIAGAIAGILLVSSARAQSPANLLGFLNVNQRANQPIDMTNVVAPAPRSDGSFHLNNLFHGFSLSNLFSKNRNPNPPSFSSSPLPAPSAFPSAKYPNSFQPMMPFYPKQ
jgi:hypothetical protein